MSVDWECIVIPETERKEPKQGLNDTFYSKIETTWARAVAIFRPHQHRHQYVRMQQTCNIFTALFCAKNDVHVSKFTSLKSTESEKQIFSHTHIFNKKQCVLLG